jgi:hypothetical protein
MHYIEYMQASTTVVKIYCIFSAADRTTAVPVAHLNIEEMEG